MHLDLKSTKESSRGGALQCFRCQKQTSQLFSNVYCLMLACWLHCKHQEQRSVIGTLVEKAAANPTECSKVKRIKFRGTLFSQPAQHVILVLLNFSIVVDLIV